MNIRVDSQIKTREKNLSEFGLDMTAAINKRCRRPACMRTCSDIDKTPLLFYLILALSPIEC
jgi:hypothetical protein